MGELRNMFEASVDKRCAVVPLAGRQPAKRSAEPVVVVVVREGTKRRLGIDKGTEELAVQNLGLEDVPEGLNFAVGPRSADLGPDVTDVQLLKALAKAAEKPGHPADEWLAVVTHDFEGLTADLETLVYPFQDRRKSGPS